MRSKKSSLLLLSLLLALGSGCGGEGGAATAEDDHGHNHGAGHSDDDGHDHDAPAPKAAAGHAEGDGHDHGTEPHADEHGHAHGEAGGEEAHADEVKITPEAQKRWDIRVEPAQRRALVATFVAPARVAFNAEQIAHVGSVVAGRVGEVRVRVGDSVKQGQPLFVVDSPEFGRAQSEFLQRRTEAETAEGMIEVARQSFERAQRLHNQSQSIALAEVQQREGELRAAEGQARSARAAALAAENALHVLGMDQAAVEALIQSGEIDQRYVIGAPIDGRVIQREATLGESVGPDTEALVVLANLDKLWVLADVPENRIGQVEAGAPALVRIPAAPNAPIEGKVSYIAPQLDPATRTVPVRIEVAGGSGGLRPGMFAQVELGAPSPEHATSAEQVLAVPEVAIQTVEGEPAVFVAVEGEPNTFAKRSVQVAPAIGGMVPVTGGLKEGERFVASGSFILKAELGKAGAEHAH